MSHMFEGHKMVFHYNADLSGGVYVFDRGGTQIGIIEEKDFAQMFCRIFFGGRATVVEFHGKIGISDCSADDVQQFLGQLIKDRLSCLMEDVPNESFLGPLFSQKQAQCRLGGTP